MQKPYYQEMRQPITMVIHISRQSYDSMIILRQQLIALLAGFVIPVCVLLPSVGAANAQELDFEKDIWPIFQAKCIECHNGETQEGQFRMDAQTAFAEGGVSGKPVDSGSVNKSLLLQRILGKGDLDRMPLDEDPLSEKEISLIRNWIKQGAKWPAGIGAKAEAKSTHWAYTSPKTIIPPRMDSTWTINAIDQFVLNRMKQIGLEPSPAANKGKLLRRLHLDLTGMPPSLEDYQAFMKEPSDSHYEQIVDSLLASSAFGEKWARSWLDLARYADTNGFQADQFRSVWPYRDWVINAINSDMPFDQFTVEQLAGDLLPNATLDQKIATGFHRLTTCNVEAGVDPEQNRVNQVFDRINTTGTVWFGTSFECMQCHNHKYDPFTQREYYQMFAFFNKTPLEVRNSGNDIQFEFYGPKMELPLTAEQSQQTQQLKDKLAKLEKTKSQQEQVSLQTFDEWRRNQKQVTEQWIQLPITSFVSEGGAGHEILDDGSVLLNGKNPDKDVYQLSVETNLPQIDGFKFDTLTHPKLPGNGPGRHAAGGRPNFVVTEIEAILPNQKPKKVKLSSAIADFAQKNFPPSNLVDGNRTTGWAINPQFGKNHWISVLTNLQRSPQAKTTRIKFSIHHQYGGGRNIGRLRISALVGQRSNSGFPADIKKLLQSKQSKLKPGQLKRLKAFYFSQIPGLEKTRLEIEVIKKKIAAVQPLTTLVMTDKDKRENAVFKRGNFLDRGQTVKPGTPAILHSATTALESRLDFAEWVVDPQNPLTARVVVNRWWQEIFGRGIVSTAEDFGTQGERPTHPQLLDWLANELIRSGWSRKTLIKQIVMSRTYRQSARFTPEKQGLDPANIYLSRGARFRVSAETIRDSFLTIAGLMSHRLGGPPIYPPQPDGIWRHVGRNAPKYNTSTGDNRYRKGLYVFWRRSAPYPSFVNFDAPDRASCVVKRPTTNTPLQALTLLNDEAYFEICKSLAFQLAASPKDNSAKISLAFLSCTMREPNDEELGFLEQFLKKKIAYYEIETEKAVQVCGAKKEAAVKASWINLVQVLFNLDETISKD